MYIGTNVFIYYFTTPSECLIPYLLAESSLCSLPTTLAARTTSPSWKKQIRH